MRHGTSPNPSCGRRWRRRCPSNRRERLTSTTASTAASSTNCGSTVRLSIVVSRSGTMRAGCLMRIIAVIAVISAVSSGALLAQEAKKVPKDSVRVTVPGCTKGYIFTAGPKTEDQVGRSEIPEGMHLRMNGKKNLISEIRAHEGQMIQITGLMKKGQYNEGINVGGGVRITPGIGNAPGSRPVYENAPVNYIDVESWQPAAGNCPG